MHVKACYRAFIDADMRFNMKSLPFIFALAVAAVPGWAFAQSQAPAARNADTQQNQTLSVAQVGGGQWVSPDAPSTSGLTRADVYHDLVHAQRDGQLSYLNSTLYAHH
jgi:hypothetical protein